MYRWYWIADVWRKAGVTVLEEPGWQSAGRREPREFRMIVVHHTACHGHGPLDDLDILEHGRPDLSGPLCNAGVGTEGIFRAIAAGVANHAGRGPGWYNVGQDEGNDYAIGLECENRGDGTDKWPDVQYEAMARGCAALLDYGRLPTIMCVGHDEYAPDRKIDPMFDPHRTRLANGTMSDMNIFRAKVDTFRKMHIPNPPESENE